MKTIIALVDLSDVTDAVVRTGTELAQACGGRLFLLHAAQPEGYVSATEVGAIVDRESIAGKMRTEHRALEALEKGVKSQGVEVTALMVYGPVVEKAMEHAVRLEAAFIVVGSHGHGALYHLLLGNVTTGILRRSTCPVVVVPSRGAARR